MSYEFTPAQMVTPRMLWAAFLVTHFVFAGMGWLVPGMASGDADPVTTYVLAGVGTAIALASVFAVPKIAHSMASRAFEEMGEVGNPMALLFTPLMIAFAMPEGAAILALVCRFLGADLAVWSIPAGAAVIAHATTFPSATKLGGWIRG